MPSPITPNEIKNTLPNVDAGVCDRLKKVIIDFPRKVYAWLSYVYNDDGTFTEEFKQELCAIKCDNIVEPPPPPPCDPAVDPDCEEVIGDLDPVLELSGGPWTRHSGGITLLWPHESAATKYDIYRTPTILVNCGAGEDPDDQNFDDHDPASMAVFGLPEDIPSGTKVTFDGGSSITLTAKAAKDQTVIYGTWTSGYVEHLEEGHIPANKATLIRKDRAPTSHLESSYGHEKQYNNITLREDRLCHYIDRHGGKIWDASKGKDITVIDGTNIAANEVKGGVRYNYWVVAKDDYGQTSGFSNRAIGFSKFVRGFVAATKADAGNTRLLGLVWSGWTQPVPSAHKGIGQFLRLVLRGGGGAGAAGGDWIESASVTFNITAITLNTDNTVSLTLDKDVNHFTLQPTPDEINLVGNSNLKFNRAYNVASVSSNTLTTYPDEELDGETPGATDRGWIYRKSEAMPLAVPGAGGGGGGLLVAVFDIANIDEVRVRTFGSRPSPREVNYRFPASAPSGYTGRVLPHPLFQTTNLLGGQGSGGEGPLQAPYHHGGKGRNDINTSPQAGEPKNAETLTSVARDTEVTVADKNTEYDAPYYTVFEVSSDAGSNWHEIARVEDGEGGGYRDGDESDRHCIGGTGGGSKYSTDPSAYKGYTITNATGMQNSGSAALRTTALEFVPATPTLTVADQENGVFFAPGDDGNDATAVNLPSNELKGTAGKGGYIYDGLSNHGYARPMDAVEGQAKGNIFNRLGNAVDRHAPGSGGSGCIGSTELETSKLAWGGHALAGSAWVTYSGTAYDTY